ncbi:MAG: NAD-dependent succinate-semialdehyde dehydrogenase [Myxococcota bacterium]
MPLDSVNPATGERVARREAMPAHEIEGVLEAARRAQPAWAERTHAERADVLRAMAQGLRGDVEALAAQMATEMGKTLDAGRGEVEKCAWVCDYYAEHAERFLAAEPIATDATSSYVAFAPLGVVLAIMPWNFPLWQVFRFLAPTLAAGNAGVLKHASNVTGCALAIERVAHAAGVPRDLFRAVLVEGREAGTWIEHPAIAAVTLTGSTPAGRDVAQRAGRALKKCVLELGGSDAYVVLEDADLEAALETCVTSRLINVGQSCIAAKRFVLPARHRARCEEIVVEAMRRRRVGDPFGDADLGPLARADLRDELHAQVDACLARGARLLLGGEVPAGRGAYYPPTVLTDVAPGMPAYDDELFGPVAALVFVEDEDEAVRVANATSFGLGAAVFTRDVARGEAIARDRLEAGSCFVNAFVRSDPRLPFGGIKASGFGRELGAFGIREFVNVKTVVVA